MGKELLFEIGVEEIPSTYMPGMLAALEKNARSLLGDLRLDFEGLTVCGTPRRLVLHVTGLPDQQEPVERKGLGPPVSAAFDKDGHPTKAALGFAKTFGVEVTDLSREDTPKGERLAFVVKDPGSPTSEALPFLLDGLIRQLPSPKSMRWKRGKFAFVRPIHWVLALYEGKPLTFSMTESGQPEPDYPRASNITRGHRFMANKSFEVSGYDGYISKLHDHFVEPIIDDGEGGGRIP
ncbi:MAG: glycine--tRNA ligase subunit beta, partial [bacterium]